MIFTASHQSPASATPGPFWRALFIRATYISPLIGSP